MGLEHRSAGASHVRSRGQDTTLALDFILTEMLSPRRVLTKGITSAFSVLDRLSGPLWRRNHMEQGCKKGGHEGNLAPHVPLRTRAIWHQAFWRMAGKLILGLVSCGTNKGKHGCSGWSMRARSSGKTLGNLSPACHPKPVCCCFFNFYFKIILD